VGCHTSTTTSTTINFGGSKIPIVYNTGGYPVDALAGGNFYWTSQGVSYDGYGHNVYGIADTDSILSIAPGRKSGTCTTNTCHATLADPPNINNSFKGGCQGCHTQTAHHDDSKPWYRFLKGHQDTIDYVTGIEDPNWEQPSTRGAGHNKYKGISGPAATEGVTLEEINTISSFCGGCHGKFHKEADIGSSSPWKRHPTDITLYDKGGEYQGYDTVNSYSVEAPVAWTDPASPSLGTAVVMCLSCHRPHGSDQPDMLRWDYSTMIAGGTSTDTGCFTCHTSKNVAP
jgi:predicted CXXCH cytochrome family protein